MNKQLPDHYSAEGQDADVVTTAQPAASLEMGSQPSHLSTQPSKRRGIRPSLGAALRKNLMRRKAAARLDMND